MLKMSNGKKKTTNNFPVIVGQLMNIRNQHFGNNIFRSIFNINYYCNKF